MDREQRFNAENSISSGIRDQTPSSPRQRRRLGVFFCILFPSLILGVFSIWWSIASVDRAPLIDPPTANTDRLFPEVASVLGDARREVVTRPRDDAAWGRLGMALIAHEMSREAEVCFAQAERFNPREFRWPYLRGAVLEPVDKVAALDCYARAVRLDPKAMQPRLNSAESLLDLNRLDEAETALSDALRQSPLDSRAEFLMGRLWLLRGDMLQSRRWALLSAEHQRGQRATHELLVQISHRLGDDAAAARQLDLLGSLPPGMTFWEDPYIAEAMAFRRGPYAIAASAGELAGRGSNTQSIDLLKHLVQAHPNTPEFHEQLVQSLLKAGRVEQAVEAARSATLLQPRHPVLAHQLGLALQTKQEFLAAADEFRRAISLKPDYAACYVQLGQCFRALDRMYEALAAFCEARRLEPDDLEARVATAEVLYQLGQFQESLEQLEVAAHIEPTSERIRQLRAQLESATSPMKSAKSAK